MSKENLPYNSAKEHLGDLLGFLDLLLDAKRAKGGTPDFIRMLADNGADSVGENGSRDDGDIPRAVEDLRLHIRARENATECALPFAVLRDTFALSDMEALALIAAAAPLVDIKYERLYEKLNGGVPVPNLRLVSELFSLWQGGGESVWDFWNGEEKRSLLWETKSAETMTLRPLVLRAPAVSFLLGKGAGFEEADKKADCEEVFCDGILRQLASVYPYCREMAKKDGFKVLCVYGRKGVGKRAAIRLFCDGAYMPVVFLKAENLADEAGNLTEEAKNRVLASILVGGALCITDAEEANNDGGKGIRRALAHLGSLTDIIFVTINDDVRPAYVGYENIAFIEFESPLPSARKKIWQAFMCEYPVGENVSADDFAWQYDLTAGEIKNALREAHSLVLKSGRDKIEKYDIVQAILAGQHLDLEGLATRQKVVYGWDDIELSDDQRKMARLVISRMQQRDRLREEWGLGSKNAYGNGLSVLLYGPPGTGKTMLAQVFARELGMALYRVDLSQITSKYIGETEKNLSRIFDEASKLGVILFFDEADSLFSKRTEVKDSHDKHANSQTAYLLQRIEQYDGMVILATNLYNNFDNAFLRRLTYAIHFEKPDVALREKLWRTILPDGMPKDPTINYGFFAEKFDFTGSSIKAILYSAAHIAAAAGETLHAEHIFESIKYENQKQGKLVSDDDFAGYLPKR